MTDSGGPAPRRRRPTFAEDVAQQLREEIRSGALTAGSHLRQNDIAERLEVSVTPVREAFHLLEREGLVRRIHQRGVMVFQPTVDDVEGCFEIRAALESLAARHASEHLTEDNLDRLKAVLHDMSTALGATSRYVELNATFHQIIENAARIPRLSAMIDDLRNATNAYVLLLGGGAATAAETQDEHERIFMALAARDADEAASAMSGHLQARKAAIVARMRARG